MVDLSTHVRTCGRRRVGESQTEVHNNHCRPLTSVETAAKPCLKICAGRVTIGDERMVR